MIIITIIITISTVTVKTEMVYQSLAQSWCWVGKPQMLVPLGGQLLSLYSVLFFTAWRHFRPERRHACHTPRKNWEMQDKRFWQTVQGSRSFWGWQLGSACTQAFLKLRTQAASPAQPNNYLFPGTGHAAPTNLAPICCGCQDGMWPNWNQCCQVSCRHCPEFQRHYALFYSSWDCSVGFLFHGDLV